MHDNDNERLRLVAGGQGRSDEELMEDGLVATWIAGLVALAFLVALVIVFCKAVIQ